MTLPKYRFVWLTALAVFALLAACGKNESPKTPAKEAADTAQSQAPKKIDGRVDLGGDCLPPGTVHRLALTYNQEQQLRQDGAWDPLIAAFKEDVRSDCTVPHRWEKLFTALVRGHHYGEAVQVLNDMSVRAFPLPHAIVSRADAAFLDSNEFKDSARGAEFAVRDKEVQENLRRALNQLSSMADEDRPPKLYKHAGACPFECCKYRQWKTISAVQLQESIDSPTIVAEIPAGVSVTGLTGEVQVEPEPYAVLEDNGALKAGDVIFFLDNRGEGYVNYWYRGKLNPEIDIGDGLLFFSYEDCQSNAARVNGACSLRKLQPEKKFRKDWWVRIRYAGKEGWVLNTGQFTNIDACG